MQISLSDTGKRFNAEWIFRKASYRFSTGNSYAITGPNGSGKSTLIQVIAGSVEVSEGSVNYEEDGKTVAREDFFRKMSIAAPYQELVEEMTLLEFLQFHQKFKPFLPSISAAEIIDIIGLERSSGKQIRNYSSGMKQRLKLALALYSEAGIYFLDEPGTNLDARAFEWYREELRQLPAGAMVFVASNNPAEYPASATSINIMDFKR